MSNQEDKNNQMTNKPNIFPMDLAPKIALVKPSDSKGATVQTQQAFRTITPQMRVVMPSTTVQAAGTAQLIQTHLMPQAMLKQVDVSGRAQISALPARTMTQTSITVTRPPTPNTFVPRGPTTVTNIGVPRTSGPTTIRAPTPPSNVTNLTTSFVRGAIPPRTPSPAGTIIAPGSATWMSGSSPVQLIRTNIGSSPRTRIVSQTVPANVSNASSGITTISANIVTQSQPQSQHNQVQTSGTSQANQQTYVNALSSVLPPAARQQTATLVYTSVSNPQQQFTSTQRLAVATPVIGQRQVRPIQLSSARLPTSGIRVSSANISIRAPNIPVLTPTSVLTTMANTVQGRATVSTSNLTASGLSTARIIQVQQPQSGGAPQVISSRIGNVMTLHPVIMNAATGGTRAPTAAKVQPSLTITHVGKLASSITSQPGTLGQPVTTIASSNIVTTVGQHQPVTTAAIISSQGTQPTQVQIQTQPQHTHQHTQIQQIQHQQQQPTQIQIQQAQPQIIQQHQQQSQHLQSQTQQQQQQHIHQPQQITQIVGINQQGNVSHGHQIIIGNQVPASATVVPLTLTPRNTVATLANQPATSTATVSQIVRTSMNMPITNSSNLLPIAKVLPQQQPTSIETHSPATATIQSGVTQNVYIHARSPNTAATTATIVASSSNATSISNNATAVAGGTTFQTSAGQFYYEPISTAGGNTVLTLTTSTITSIISSSSSLNSTAAASGNVTTVTYAPQASSFAVVPSANRNIGQIHSMIPLSTVTQANQVQTVPVRFNPQLIVDGNQTIQSGATSHQIISIQQSQQQQHHQQQHQQNSNQSIGVNVSGAGPQQTHMLIPVSAKISTQSPRTPVMRKRDIEGQAISKSIAKNLQPALMAMTTSSVEKDREPPRAPTPRSRPGSSGGSTTVSANSSPGLDQQEQEELNSMSMKMRVQDVGFKTVEEIYVQPVPTSVPQQQQQQQQQQTVVFQQQMSTTSSSSTNGTMEEAAARKKPRKTQARNDGGNQSKKHQVNSEPIQYPTVQEPTKTHVRSNKENSKPTEIYIKKPRTCTLLEGYKHNWKAANNHFQRYSDVKPREERRPTVMDLANQANVVQKVNGWKIYHLNSQMEDLCELETQVYDKLSSMLKIMERHTQSVDVDRVNDLIKGNMQRSKIVADGINDARSQIMKIFDHKAHVADIIHRCASKRNFKKREKA